MITTPLTSVFDFFIFGDLTAFLFFIIVVGGIAGLISRSVAVGAFGSFIIFTFIAINVDVFIFTEMLYLLLVLMFLFMAYQLVGYLLDGGSNGL